MINFFHRFERFFETSRVGTKTPAGARSQRLPRRWEAIVAANASLFEGASVLDIASHDGRWSMAAVDAGARRVLGIEGRSELVAHAYQNFFEYAVPPDRYEFRVGNLPAALGELPAGGFDLILNLGFFYHTARHYDVFEQMHRLGAPAVILDTFVDPGPIPAIRYHFEPSTGDQHSLPSTPGVPRPVVGVPSLGFVEMMCEHFGYRHRPVDWNALGIDDWEGLDDYRTLARRTFVLERS